MASRTINSLDARFPVPKLPIKGQALEGRLQINFIHLGLVCISPSPEFGSRYTIYYGGCARRRRNILQRAYIALFHTVPLGGA